MHYLMKEETSESEIVTAMEGISLHARAKASESIPNAALSLRIIFLFLYSTIAHHLCILLL